MNIFEFSDYRIYISTWLDLAKKEGSSNLSKLAKVLRVHPTFLSQVLTGSKELSLEQAAYLTQYLSHTKLEQEYFFVLIQLSRAGTDVLRNIFLEQKRAIEVEKNKLMARFKKHRQLNGEDKAIFYSSWIYVAVWAATGIGSGQSLAAIAKMFTIQKSAAEAVLTFLVQTGLCKLENGLYSPGEVHVHVPNESPFVVKHHTNWRIKAIQKMDSRKGTELFFTGPMSIAKKDFETLRERLNGAIREVIEMVKLSEAEEVVCLNIDFFKVETPSESN